MATLTAGISASDSILPVSEPVENGFYTIDTEAIYVHGQGAQVRSIDPPRVTAERGIAGTTAASHLSGATLTRYYPDAASSGGGGGVAVLEDPGNVWQRNTAMAVGHRFADDYLGALRVFEITDAGTTADVATLAELEPKLYPGDVNSLGGTTLAIYLGVVGQLPWPTLIPGFSPFIEVDSSDGQIQITHAEPPSESGNMFSLRARVAGVPVSVFDSKTDGDADWFLDENTGAGFRWNKSADGVPGVGVAEVTYEHFRTFATVRMENLPTADPTISGALWVDVAAGRVLKVSAG